MKSFIGNEEEIRVPRVYSSGYRQLNWHRRSADWVGEVRGLPGTGDLGQGVPLTGFATALLI